MSDGVFSGAYQLLDAYWVGEQLEMGAWTELLSTMRVMPIDGYFELDFLAEGLGVGTYRFALVSSGSIDDPSVSVDTIDLADWVYADFNGGFCGTYSEEYCYTNRYDDADICGDGTAEDMDSYAVRVLWDGATFAPAPETYIP